MSLFIELIVAFCAVLLESAPLVVLGFVIAGIAHEFVPAKRIRSIGGGRGLAPVARAAGLGALLPICSCSTIPLGVAMTRSGASIGTALAFMTTSPAVSPVTVVVGWGLLGPVLLGWYSTIAVAGALVIGVVGNRWLSHVPSDGESASKCGCGCGCGAAKTAGDRFAAAMRWAFGDLGREVSASLIVGLLIASLVLVAIPPGVAAGWLGQPSWLALLAAIALALPAYTCSVPSLVIAGSLLARGVDPGVAVAFLIAGPATNLGELNAIRRAMGAKAAAFYAASLVVVALAAGAATAWLPGGILATEMTSHAGHDHVHTLDSLMLGTAGAGSLANAAWWRWPFAAGVLLLAIGSLKPNGSMREANKSPVAIPAHPLAGVAAK